MEVMEKPPVAESKVDAEFTRFVGVAATRRLPTDFIELFEKLRLSDMFSPEVKPKCFAHLIEESAKKVPTQFVTRMLDAVEKSKAVSTMYEGLGDHAEEVFSPLVRRLFEITPMTASPQLDVFYRLERMGISPERGTTIAMALAAGATMEFMDKVCDMTFYEYYPSMPQVAAKKTA